MTGIDDAFDSEECLHKHVKETDKYYDARENYEFHYGSCVACGTRLQIDEILYERIGDFKITQTLHVEESHTIYRKRALPAKPINGGELE